MTASAKEVIAKTAGDYYDGYADPADTPENWSRGLGCANDILAALDAAGYGVYRIKTIRTPFGSTVKLPVSDNLAAQEKQG